MARDKIEAPTKISSVNITSFRNSWQANGLNFYQVCGNVVHLHCSIRNGDYSEGVGILYMGTGLKPITTSLAPIFNISGKTFNGYVLIDVNGDVKLYNVTNTSSVVFDLYWTT